MATHVASPLDSFGNRDFGIETLHLHPIEDVGLEAVVTMAENNIQKAVIVEITYPGPVSYTHLRLRRFASAIPLPDPNARFSE